MPVVNLWRMKSFAYFDMEKQNGREFLLGRRKGVGSLCWIDSSVRAGSCVQAIARSCCLAMYYGCPRK